MLSKAGKINVVHQKLFKEPVESMCKSKSIQFLRCWLHSYQVAVAFTNRLRMREYQLLLQFQQLIITDKGNSNSRQRKQPRNSGTLVHSSRPASKPFFYFKALAKYQVPPTPWQIKASLEQQYGRK